MPGSVTKLKRQIELIEGISNECEGDQEVVLLGEFFAMFKWKVSVNHAYGLKSEKASKDLFLKALLLQNLGSCI